MPKIKTSKRKRWKLDKDTGYTRHGLSKHPLYQTWRSMIQRCYFIHHKSYPYYGGRGIKVCDKWLHPNKGLKYFVEDMGLKPNASCTLDRINNELDYTPSNCRWSSKSLQVKNRRPTSRNNTGFIGIKKLINNKYQVGIGYNKTWIYLGVYSSLEDAKIARKNAENKFWK